MNPNMAAVHSFILFQMFFGFLHQGLALISDYKFCGDPECERMISRVQAQRDHVTKDCRFLNFKKGDIITVYYKLTGKRNDLWAGSTEKLFGLFPKDAIKVDQLFIDEKKEIQVPTQEFDFMCFDENGVVIEPSTEFDDTEDLTQETQENNINEVYDTPNDDTEETEPIQISPQDVSNQNSPETTEKGGSSWIGSAVSGWFGRNEQSNAEPQDESSEESFKSRKIVMDIEERHAEEKENSGAFGWLSGELTNAFGFGNQDLKTDAQENIDTPTDDKQTNSWMSMGRDALGFGEDNSAETEAQKAEENPNMEDQSLINPNQSMENDPDEDESEKVEEQTGWYGGIYNQITNLYGEEQTKHDENDDEILPEEKKPEFATDIKNIETKESEPSSQSIFSVSGLASVMKLPFQEDVVVKTDEEQTGKSEDPGISKDECFHEACLDVNKDTVISSKEVENNPVIAEMSDINDLSSPQNEPVSQKKEISSSRAIVKDVQSEQIRKEEDWTSSDIKKTTAQNHVLFSEELVESQNGEGYFYHMAVFVEDTIYEIASIVVKVVSSLPDDIRPGPDLYGLPWEAVFFTGFLGLSILLLFTCRFIQSIKSRLYASKEKQMAHKMAELLDEKCKVLETFSEVKQKFDKLESTLQNNGMSARAAEKDTLEVASQKLEQSNAQMKKEIERLQEELSQQNKARKQQEDQLAELEQILRNLEEEAKERKSQLEQDNTTLKIHEINTERLQKNLLAAKEEHTMLLESKEQLMQEAEGWGERLSELEEEMKMCERSHAGMMEDCANKDDRIKSLTECLLKMRDWDSEDETSIDGSTNIAGAANGDSSDFHQKQKVQKLIEAAKMSADLKSLEEDKNRVFAKLADEIKAKEDLHEGIKQLEEQKELLVSESANYSSESQKLQQKLQIMTEMYQENELKLHRMLTVEEKERLQKEEKLNKAGKKISLAAEELNTYRQRAKDLEDELDRTSQAFKNQISSHEKKAHDNWLAARAADRDLADVKRENAHLRQRLTDAQFRFDILEKDVREGRPIFRGERSPYGPSPLGRPSSETRTFLSPPTLMDGPPRLSPQFMGPGRGHPLPDPGLPYRRPPPGPYPMGPLPPRPPLPPEQYFGDKSDSSFLRNSSSISEHEGREGSGDMRLPPDPDSRMGPLPPPGPPLMSMPPPMDPRDPHFPHRGPFGPPDYFPPRGPHVLPMGMRGPLPPGMFPRAPVPFPQHMGFLPPRAPSDSFTHGPPPRPSPPGSEQPPDQPPAPHDAI
ncbi:cTAGE family member 5 isoform X4 [Danio rerio]|uniref:CTAGE family member 5 isoform X4 n=1 Tax=Danio rerio TaxID=7955 RepID=A0AC58HMC0_DANRE